MSVLVLSLGDFEYFTLGWDRKEQTLWYGFS